MQISVIMHMSLVIHIFFLVMHTSVVMSIFVIMHAVIQRSYECCFNHLGTT